MQQEPLDVIVLGAGLAGLTVAFRARQAGLRVKVLEKTGRAGGVIRSERTEGYLLEHGPNTVQPKGELMSLIQELGLEKNILLADPRLPRFVRFRGDLHTVPMSPPALFRSPLLSVRGRLRALVEPFIPSFNRDIDESLQDFARRRLGVEIADRLVAPFVSGVWAGDSEQLSAMSAFPSLHRWETRHGSLIKGALAERRRARKTTALPKGLLSFYDGMESLPKALAESLGENVLLNTATREIRPEQPIPGEVIWHVRLDDRELLARNIVMTAPAFETAPLVAPFAPAAAAALDAIPYVPVSVVHLGFRSANIGREPRGFGFLSTPSENTDLLGCIWSSSLFGGRAPEGHHLFSMFLGGARHRELAELPDNELVNRSLTDLQETMKINGRPDFVRVARHPRGIPQYTIGHGRRTLTLMKTEKLFPGLKFAGNFIDGLGVGDVIRQATTLAGSEL